jgi:hypothetical protein
MCANAETITATRMRHDTLAQGGLRLGDPYPNTGVL